MDAAKEDKDSVTESFLKWFVTEQIEEEATPANILKDMELNDSNDGGVSAVNSKLAKRVYNPPRG